MSDQLREALTELEWIPDCDDEGQCGCGFNAGWCVRCHLCEATGKINADSKPSKRYPPKHEPGCFFLSAALAALSGGEPELRQAFHEVCREGCVPQYEDIKAEDITGDGIRHGVRQLAALYGNEKVLRAASSGGEPTDALRQQVFALWDLAMEVNNGTYLPEIDGCVRYSYALSKKLDEFLTFGTPELLKGFLTGCAPTPPVEPVADDSTIQRFTLAEALLREIRTTLFLQPDMIRSDTGERGDGEMGEFIGRINRLLGDQKVSCPDCNGYIDYAHADDCPRSSDV